MNKDNQTHKTKRLLLILVLVLIVLGVGGFLLWQNASEGGLNISTDNLFPFGNPTNRVEDPIDNEVTEPIGGGIRADEFQPLSRNRLRLLAKTAVAGYVPVISNDYYITQAGMGIYNQARGEVDTNTLPVLRSPRVRYIEQSNAYISESSLNDNSQSIRISSTDIPNIWDAFFDEFGNNLVMRRYDSSTTLIETFATVVKPSDEPYYCDLPQDITFEIGDEHPGIAGVKSALNKLYSLSVTDNDIFDTNLEENLVTAFANLGSTTTSTEELNTDIIDPVFLADLKEACLVISNERIDNLPVLLSGEFLENDIEEMALNSQTGDLLTLKPINNKVIGTLRDINRVSTSKTNVFESNFTEWLAHWPNSESVFLQTKPSWNIEGYLYRLVPDSNRFEKILGDKQGLLATVSPNEQYVLYSETNPISESLQTTILNLQTRESRTLPFATLGDKCSWSSNSEFLICAAPTTEISEQEPDNWLKGISTYIDEFWVVNAESMSSKVIYSPVNQQNRRFDVYKIQIDPRDNNYVYFMDKNNNNLWSLEIDGLDGRD